jgi:ribonucleotide monophosphatase NagD (HAD superfamily)
VIGDNPDSDVVAAHRAGMVAILVLTGVTAAADVAGLDGERVPDFVVAGPAEAWELLAPMVSR